MNYLSRENVEEVLGLSPLQARLADQQANGADQPIAQATYLLSGDLNDTALQDACDHAIALHPTLRVVFRAVKNRMVQVVLKSRPIPMHIHDLQGTPVGEQEAAAATIIHEARNQTFALAEGPLIRLTLIRLADCRSLLVWTHHEIILDERSRAYVTADLLATYEAIMLRKPLPRTGRRPYREYLTWLADQDWTAAAGFWAAQRIDADDTTQFLPEAAGTERPATPVVRRLNLPTELSAALGKLAHGHGTEESALLQALWAIFLSCYCNEDHVLFGLHCPGRPAQLPGSEGMVGRFAAAMPVRAYVDDRLLLPAFLHEARRDQAALRDYAPSTPGEPRGSSGKAGSTAVFDTYLTIHEEGEQRFEGDLISAERLIMAQGNGCRLAIEVTLGGQWTIAMSSSAYSPPALECFLRHFQGLLQSCVDRPESRIADLSILQAEERRRLLSDFTSPELGPPPDRLFHQVIADQAERRPEAVAAIHGQTRITYGALNARADALAWSLRLDGFGRESLAALLAERGIDMLVAILAVAKAGGAFMPLDAAYPDARLATLLTESRASIILTQEPLIERGLTLAAALAAPPAVISLDAGWSPGGDVPPVNQPHDLAYVFYTSGSTGTPKGAMVEHVGMLNHLWAKVRLLDLNEQSIVVQNASHCFDISVWQFLAPLMVGGAVVICDNESAADPRALLAVAQTSRATVLEVVPTMLDMLLQSVETTQAATPLPDLRYLISTAEALPVTLCRRWFEAFPQVTMINAYGPTECSDDTTHERITAAPSADLSYLPVGTVIANFAVYILDRRQRPVPMGSVGEIYFAGVGVGRGYLHDPERTAAAFIPNPFASAGGDRLYRTGDLGRFLPDGRLVYIGRMDGQVKIRGRRIELGEIEAVLSRHPAVKQCVVPARADAAGRQHIVAYVVVDDSAATAALRAYLASVLPDYMIPEHIVQLGALPLNRNGKVDRKQLPDHADSVRAAAPEAPRNEIEAELANIWQEVLGVAQIGIDDGFFEYGGHSLKTVQVRSRIQQRLGIDIALRTLFEQQTIRTLAPVIARARADTGTERSTVIPRRPSAPFHPMSNAQRRLWFLQQMDPDSCFYNLPSAIELTGVLDLAAMSEAFSTLIERQDSLRTTFTLHDGQPVQRVAPRVEWASPLDDLSTLPPLRQIDAVREILHADTRTGFDLEQGPLFRVRLLKLAAEHHILLFTIHHIIGDAWSSAVLQQEFAALYRAHRLRLPNPLPPLSIQYTDFAYWQHERLAGDNPTADERFWRTTLADPLPVLNLATDHPRPPIQTYAGAGRDLVLDTELHARLSALSRENDMTLFMTLLAAVSTFLNRLSGQDDIIIGSPVAGRDRMELESLVGFFVNVLPFRIDLQGDPTFEELLRRVKQAALEAYAHQECPFDGIVRQVNPVRDLSRSPIFSVMFQLDNASQEIPLDGMMARRYSLPQEFSRFDLTIVFSETAHGLTCHIEYNADLFEPETIDLMLRRLRMLLEGIVAGPTNRLHELPLLGEPERLLLQERWNTTAGAYPRDACIHDLIAAQASRTPTASAVRIGDRSLTYEELDRRSNQVAHGLRRLGVGPEMLVGICMERSLELLVGLLGILKAGAAYLPLEPSYPAERLAYMLEDARVSVLLTHQLLASGLPTQGATVLCLDAGDGPFVRESYAPPHGGARPANLAYTIYTSGSTGKPKGVQITHGNVVNFLQTMSERPNLTAADTLLAVTGFSFDIAALELFLPLTVGARLVIASREDAAEGTRLATLLEASGATVLQATPATWRLLLAAGWRNTGGVRMLCGGEALPAELASQLVADGAVLWNMYGPTETTIWSTIHPVTAASANVVSIGRPIANTRIYLLDRHLRLAPLGVPGELYIGGDGVARGYLRRPEMTAERFIPDPFSATPGARLYGTGDLARYLPNGDIEYLGRLDNQVKIRGYRIELGEIEAVLMRHPQVRQALVTARQDRPGDARLSAYIVPRADQAPTACDLRAFLVGMLPEYMIPSAFVPLDALPLTLNGKVDRRALPTPGVTQLSLGHAYVAPSNPLEVAMSALWEEILRLNPIGIHDDFFEIGGHSMTAVMLVTAIRRNFTINLPLTVLFQAPTIADLCAYLRVENRLASRIVTPIRVGGAQPPLFLVHPQGGGVLCYLHLARALDGATPVYGVEAVGYDSDETPLTTIQAMADLYVEEIRRVAPHGPYRIAGWSFGGLVAFEMVRRLEALDEEVAFLGLIDVYAFGQEEDDALFEGGAEGESEESALINIAVHQLGMDRSELEGIDEEQGIALILRRAKELNLIEPDAVADTVRRRVRMMTNNADALRSYRYSGRARSDIHLFRALDVHGGGHPAVDETPWRRRTTGETYAVGLPGDHHNLVNPPYVHTLAEEINALPAFNRIALEPVELSA